MVQHSAPFTIFQDVSPDDSADLPLYTSVKILTGSIYVGSMGDVVAVSGKNIATTFSAVPAGTTLQIGVRRINATGTSASNLVALYTA